MFVGLKMVWLNEAFGGKFPIDWSLGIIGALLAVSMPSLSRRGATAAPSIQATDAAVGARSTISTTADLSLRRRKAPPTRRTAPRRPVASRSHPPRAECRAARESA